MDYIRPKKGNDRIQNSLHGMVEVVDILTC